MQTHLSLLQEAADAGWEKTPSPSWLDAGEWFHYAYVGFLSSFGLLILKLMCDNISIDCWPVW